MSEIRSRIKGRVAIAGIGNIMRSDDGLGPKLIDILKRRSVNAHLFDCGTVPENYIFPMLSTSCDTIILVDAADMKMPPGSAVVLGIQDIADISFSTHNPSPHLFLELLKTGKEDINIFVISVQPKSVAMGQPMSDEVICGLDILAGAIAGSLED